jgi:hypothetical protein
MVDLNELEIKITEVKVSEEEYQKRLVRLINQLLEIDQANEQREDEPEIEVAA